MAIYRAAMVTEVNSVATANVMHFNEATPPASGPSEDGLFAFLTDPGVSGGFAAAWQPLMTAEAMITCVKVQKVSPAPLGTQKLFFSSLSGTESGESLPSNIAALIANHGATGGRRGRGRNYFAGLAESLAAKGRLTLAGFALLQDLANVLAVPNGNATVGSWELRVFSKADDAYYDPVVCYADPVLRNQRDRITNLCS